MGQKAPEKIRRSSTLGDKVRDNTFPKRKVITLSSFGIQSFVLIWDSSESLRFGLAFCPYWEKGTLSLIDVWKDVLGPKDNFYFLFDNLSSSSSCIWKKHIQGMEYFLILFLCSCPVSSLIAQCFLDDVVCCPSRETVTGSS